MLARSLLDAFGVAAGELGMYSAARIFVAELGAEGGRPLLADLRDLVGTTYPVLDELAARAIAGDALPRMDPSSLLEALDGLNRIVIVGNEASLIDALVDGLSPGVKVGVVLDGGAPAANEARVAANFEARARLMRIEDVLHWAGSRSALVTTIYGSDGHRATVCSAWLRLMGSDTRTSFGAFVGWNVLGGPMTAYPRWLRETVVDDFTAVVSSGDGS